MVASSYVIAAAELHNLSGFQVDGFGFRPDILTGLPHHR